MGVAIALLMTSFAVAQTPAPTPTSTPATTPVAATTPDAPATQDGYAIHHTADLGGHIANISGSGAMYDTLINIHSGPRVLGQTFTMHALPGTKHSLLDDLSVFSNGFGGDPINFAKMDFSKGKLYEFSGNFRRDRQYFDYDLLANPDAVPQTVPYGLVNGLPTATSLVWPKINQSPMMFNTVRRMTDTNLTILPLSKVTFRAGYSQSIFQGPSLSPGRSIGKNDGLLMEFQRNSTDDFTAAIDWKPVQHTRVTFEEQVDHYKADSYFTLAPQSLIAQEADGTPVALGNWDSDRSVTPERDRTAESIASLLITRSGTSSAYAESFNQLFANLAFASEGRPLKVIAFTSPLPGEGKTLSAINFALAGVARGLRVLLVDADLRCGVVSTALGIDRAPGFAEMLAGTASPVEAVRRVARDEAGSLLVIPSGALPKDPARVLTVERIRDVLALMIPKVDLVVIDTPPVNLLADAGLLGAAADAVLLVVRAGHTQADDLRYAMEQLAAMRAPVIGTLLNDIDVRRNARDDGSYRYLAEAGRYHVSAS